MEKQVEYTLELLGDWYADKAQRHYRDQEARKTIAHFIDSLEVVFDAYPKLTEEDKESTRDVIARGFSVLGFRDYCRNHFSHNYKGFEDFLKGDNIEGEKLSDIPKGLREEYLERGIEIGKLVKVFVDNVRKETDIRFPENLTYEEVDRIFIDSFGSIDNFISYIKKEQEAALLAVNYQVIRGHSHQAEFDAMKVFFNRCEWVFEEINRKLFSDLESKL